MTRRNDNVPKCSGWELFLDGLEKELSTCLLKLWATCRGDHTICVVVRYKYMGRRHCKRLRDTNKINEVRVYRFQRSSHDSGPGELSRPKYIGKPSIAEVFIPEFDEGLYHKGLNVVGSYAPVVDAEVGHSAGKVLRSISVARSKRASPWSGATGVVLPVACSDSKSTDCPCVTDAIFSLGVTDVGFVIQAELGSVATT